MLDNQHPMGLPVEPCQWFVSIQDAESAAQVHRHPIVQVRDNDEENAAQIALDHYGLKRQEGRTWIVIRVRSRHKKLPVINP